MKRRFLTVLLPLLIAGAAFAAPGDNYPRGIPIPLPSHPGNIFVSSERVIVSEPPGEGDSWQVIDYEGNVMLAGRFAGGRADLGRLPTGYYQMLHGSADYSSNRVTIGVIEPLKAPIPEDSPIGIDVAMAWFFSGERMKEVANLCALAGMNRGRERLSWEEIETK